MTLREYVGWLQTLDQDAGVVSCDSGRLWNVYADENPYCKAHKIGEQHARCTAGSSLSGCVYCERGIPLIDVVVVG